MSPKLVSSADTESTIKTLISSPSKITQKPLTSINSKSTIGTITSGPRTIIQAPLPSTNAITQKTLPSVNFEPTANEIQVGHYAPRTRPNAQPQECHASTRGSSLLRI